MLKSISYWSFEGGLGGKKPLADAFAEAKKKGYEAVELTIGDSPELQPGTTEAECKAIRKQADKAGVKISSIANGMLWTCLPTDDRESVRKKAVDLTKKSLQLTKWLGCPGLLYIPGAVDVFFLPDAKIVPENLDLTTV